MLGFISALSLLIGGAQPCQAALPHGPAVPAPIVLKTDCGRFRLATDGEVTRLPGNWLATHTSPSQPHYTIGRTRPGRYLVLRDGKVIWRSRGLYRNEAGNWAFGEHSFAFDSWGRRALFVTDLRGPERLVLRGRNTYPIGFSRTGQLLVWGPRTITILALDGTVLRTIRYRQSSSYTVDEATKTLYFVTPDGVLSAADGSRVRRIGSTRERREISLLGRRLITFSTQRHVAILRRSDASLVASAGWRGAKRELDSEVAVSDDGRLFAFRVARSPRRVSVYLLRAGEHRARPVYSHHYRLSGCGSHAGLAGNGAYFLYFSDSDDVRSIPESALIAGDGAVTKLTPLWRALPRKFSTGEESAYWEADFSGK
jgi:hypothetical protein